MFIGYYINTNYVLWLIPVDTTLKDTSILKVLLWIVKTTQYKTAWTGSERVYQFTHILACCAPTRVARERIANKTRVSLDKRRGGGLHRLNQLNRLNRTRRVWVSIRIGGGELHRLDRSLLIRCTSSLFLWWGGWCLQGGGMTKWLLANSNSGKSDWDGGNCE